MLSDSSEPLVCLRRADPFILGACNLGWGHFYVAYQFVSMAWPYQSKKGAGNVELHFLKKN